MDVEKKSANISGIAGQRGMVWHSEESCIYKDFMDINFNQFVMDSKQIFQ